MNYFLEIMLGTVAALIPIINPFSTSSIFLSLTFLDSDSWRQRQALLGSLYMFLILTGFLLFGTLIINFFGISLPGMRIAGGILVAKIAFNMLYGSEATEQETKEIKQHRLKKDISFFPLAMPSLAGPGAIAVTISISTLAKGSLDYVAIICGLVILGLITYAVLRSATYFKKWLGDGGIKVMTKLMGFLLFCVGVQFVINGIVELEIFN
jgi:multiple antibiotic resistance protein